MKPFDIELDDEPVGRVWSRKEVLTLLSGAGFALLLGAGCGSGSSSSVLTEASPSPTASSSPTASPSPTATPVPNCVASPELTEGPYFVDERLNRSDIRTDPTDGTTRAGIPLVLTLYVADVSDACTPLSGVMVDVWHCDAAGKYSDVSSEGTAGKKFLRGYQLTDTDGKVTFTTIYPGWYSGRAVHLHFKVRSTTGTSWEFTSQFFFNETTTSVVHAQSPYSAKGIRNTFNTSDGIYRQGGSELVLDAQGSNASGYAATFTIGVNV